MLSSSAQPHLKSSIHATTSKNAAAKKQLLSSISSEVRMTQHIYSALLFMKYNAIAQFVTEINAALDENNICEKSIMSVNFSEQERYDLYRDAMKLNIERSEDKHYGFAYKLQMRKMLQVKDEHAEKLELEASLGTGSFNI